MAYYTYMLRCADASLYTGITTDVNRRFEEHLSRGEKCAKYTMRHRAEKIEAVWESESRVTASKLEFWIKKLTKAQKEKLIKENGFTMFGEKIQSDKYNRMAI